MSAKTEKELNVLVENMSLKHFMSIVRLCAKKKHYEGTEESKRKEFKVSKE